ncbi:MAG: isoprenylcysteine carboxylmethyltransferase family protein [Gammaproteobacteria bacterium]|nr:MAG: isoprenylcysteine carboxylmethyltransferase family protein [Gammaproteobacteria bacterium]
MEPKRKIVPPVYLLLAMSTMLGLHRWAPLARLIAPPYTYFGVAFIALALALGVPAIGAFQKAGTPVIPFERATALVTSGSFRFTRNPMYLGMALLLFGVAVLLGSAGAFLPIPVFVWIIQMRFIRGEERFLEDLFGKHYVAYKSRVRRWI